MIEECSPTTNDQVITVQELEYVKTNVDVNTWNLHIKQAASRLDFLGRCLVDLSPYTGLILPLIRTTR